MHCNICDKTLTDEEVKWNRLHQDFDPCFVCKEVIHGVFSSDRDEGTLDDEGYDDGSEDEFDL